MKSKGKKPYRFGEPSVTRSITLPISRQKEAMQAINEALKVFEPTQEQRLTEGGIKVIEDKENLTVEVKPGSKLYRDIEKLRK